MVLEEDADVGMVSCHQLEDVGHHRAEGVIGREIGRPRRRRRQEQVDERLVDSEENLVLGGELVVERRLA